MNNQKTDVDRRRDETDQRRDANRNGLETKERTVEMFFLGSRSSITDHHLSLEESIDDAGEKWDECLEVNKRTRLVFLTYLIIIIIVLGGVERDTNECLVIRRSNDGHFVN
jgi:hypothetical protein